MTARTAGDNESERCAVTTAGSKSATAAATFISASGSGVRVFNMAFGLESGNAELIGFTFDEMAFGSEYLIRYRSSGGDGGGEGDIETITATGRKKTTAPCPVE